MSNSSDMRGLGTAEVYDRAASHYDAWKWQRFWELNELPIISQWLSELELAPRSRCLDVGTGTGRYAKLLSSLGCEVVGVDSSRGMLGVARERLRTTSVRLLHTDFREHRERNAYDLVLACRVLSHVRRPTQVAAHLASLLVASGYLLIADLDPAHRYRHTRLPTDDGVLDVETYKHSAEEWEIALAKRGFALRRLRHFSFKDLLWKPADGFTSLDRSGRSHVFFVQLYQLDRT